MDAGGSFIKSAVLDEGGFVHASSFFVSKSYSGYRSKEMIIGAFKENISKGLLFIGENEMVLGGIGIAIPGPFDYRNGVSLMTHKFQSLYGMNLKALIVEATGIESNLPFVFVHDANAVLYSEQWTGNAKDFANTAVVTIGTGLGFAHSQNRTIQCNEWGSPSVSIFKTPCREGILEDYVSKRGILKIYGELANKKPGNLTVNQIADLAGKGDASAIATFCEAGQLLAKAIAGVLVAKNIECLLFAGQISRSYHLMETAITEELQGIRSLKLISPVKNIDYAAFYGVLWNLNYF